MKKENKIIFVDTLLGKLPISYKWQFADSEDIAARYAEEAIVDVFDKHHGDVSEEDLKKEALEKLLDSMMVVPEIEYVTNNWLTLLELLCWRASNEYAPLLEELKKGFGDNHYFYKVLLEEKIENTIEEVGAAIGEAMRNRVDNDYECMGTEYTDEDYFNEDK